ncbi:hypothetical protein CAOG_08768 [Capsaspora owczarzaki ATCC 30864]|uniref:small monomeric GTPase n=1 Tax=Capsaspora owczarzaki (strain ATCC 30864) TaxID=595528 RepID=A0A0D2UEI6_CAPO3|nr:hypothetical protein CAOG_08768 [Capsaspora owczarzaki ATCC 30864]KJE93531.1 hypothetical protein CAOG_008768 [Capsaspora owczarzaki ATCC 30864]|eukprot:XP_011270398.1 hypothetical protein CAOG_08768 [Capsaspora owczarzaki ATCC 30864]
MSDASSDATSVHVVVVGPGGVGKSAITLSFMRNQFIEEYDPTIEDSYSKEIVVDGKKINLEIVDTAGQEEFRGLWGDKFIRQGDGFLCVYSITDKATFAELVQFRKQIHQVKDTTKAPMVIAGNKIDLEDQREVSNDEGKAFAKDSSAVFIETSAKTRTNIDETFTNLVREVLKFRAANGTPAPAAAAAPAAASTSKAADATKASSAAAAAPKKKGGCMIL